MSPETMRVFVVAVRWCKDFDDACPDVGMGPSMDMLIDRVAKECRVTPNEDERHEIRTALAKPRENV